MMVRPMSAVCCKGVVLVGGLVLESICSRVQRKVGEQEAGGYI